MSFSPYPRIAHTSDKAKCGWHWHALFRSVQWVAVAWVCLKFLLLLWPSAVWSCDFAALVILYSTQIIAQLLLSSDSRLNTIQSIVFNAAFGRSCETEFVSWCFFPSKVEMLRWFSNFQPFSHVVHLVRSPSWPAPSGKICWFALQQVWQSHIRIMTNIAWRNCHYEWDCSEMTPFHPFSILFLVKEMFEANDWHLF